MTAAYIEPSLNGDWRLPAANRPEQGLAKGTAMKKLQILGTGCSKCKRLTEQVEQAANRTRHRTRNRKGH